MAVPLRILHAPHAVAGHAPTLAAAERELGLDSESVVLSRSGPARELQRWRLLLRAFREFDVVHFNFGSTFLPRYWPSAHRGARAAYGLYARAFELRDLGWLRRRSKAVFVTFQGDDARTAESLRKRLNDSTWLDDYYDSGDDARKREALARLTNVDGVYALNPDLVPLLPGASFLPYANVDLRTYVQVPLPSNRRPVAVHSPTERRTKGTSYIVAVTGAFDLRLVEGVTRDTLRGELERADVYVDQLLIGWYGGTAVEAMALGRPVVAYLHEPHLDRIPTDMRAELPVVSATPATLSRAIEEAFDRREELAERGRRFVERWHDPLRVAERTKAAYEDAVARITRR